ncbi:uncharacterized protein SAPINGB_P002973 [Magnusiomyces paraingens]|uniref:Ribose-phosphate pyrophosphokinase 1 n=1 Tax=Magnusiomyces paraingens TaxID=2606893 RepID=A0A5E8BN65_9ASCO|nr:uncharacterized protein SAPINGB_P002973 [Saprochaete ingens]VVT51068.1 unnamed protein product [Saprochaete ingens]
MRKSHVFVGSSHPELGQLICDRLGVEPGKCTLRKFSNGETSIEIGVSVRDEDVYVVQSGSADINDHIMELLILISGCRGGSANKITAVIPCFPYAKQSKMKKHRGAITARMLANLLIMAGADHVITMDLHATQMQGFFSKPVDNLLAGPTLARWIRHNVPDYSAAVIVSKNPGGTKRVTALADALKVNFAMIHTDRRRAQHKIPGRSGARPPVISTTTAAAAARKSPASARTPSSGLSHGFSASDIADEEDEATENDGPVKVVIDHADGTSSSTTTTTTTTDPSTPPRIIPSSNEKKDQEEEDEEVSDINTQSVHVARIVQGHVVNDDEYPEDEEDENDLFAKLRRDGAPGTAPGTVGEYGSESMYSEHALGGTGDAESSDEEDAHDDSEYHLGASADGNGKAAGRVQEKVITLVGDVRGRTAILLDDMIDRAGSFVAAAELCYKNCGAKRVLVVATHAIFSGNSLEALDACPYIDQIVVTNTYPIPAEKRARCKKLVVIDVSTILAECIRRNHHGESISALFEQLLQL